MKTIFKYAIEIAETQIIELPKYSKILSVGEQYGELFLWAVVEPSNKMGTVQIEIRGTGYTIDTPDELFAHWEYINTVHQANGLVWHVFNNKAPF